MHFGISYVLNVQEWNQSPLYRILYYLVDWKHQTPTKEILKTEEFRHEIHKVLFVHVT